MSDANQLGDLLSNEKGRSQLLYHLTNTLRKGIPPYDLNWLAHCPHLHDIKLPYLTVVAAGRRESKLPATSGASRRKNAWVIASGL